MRSKYPWGPAATHPAGRPVTPGAPPPPSVLADGPHDQHDGDDRRDHQDRVDQDAECVGLGPQGVEHGRRSYSTYTVVYTMTHMMSTKCQ